MYWQLKMWISFIHYICLQEFDLKNMLNTLGKGEKLKSKKAIEKLFHEGQRLRAFPLQMNFLKMDHSGKLPYKVGFSVPKRLVKLAVNRNRIKRLMREAYRTNKDAFSTTSADKYVVMFIYGTEEILTYEKLEGAMKKLASKFNNKQSES